MDLSRDQRAAEDIYERLRLATMPVAVRYIRDASEIPNDFVRPSERRMP